MNNIYDNHKDVGLFNNGDYLVFSFKKTEKIVSAIYLVTSLIKDSDTMKWEMREGAMSLLTIMMSVNSIEPVDKNRLLQSFFSSAVELISFLNISPVAGLISEMNSSLIIREISSLVDYIKVQSGISAHRAGFILSDSFFAGETPLSSNQNSVIPSKSSITSKNKDIVVKDRKDDRKSHIIALLKKSSHLTIKDFVKVITDCSEKTIQRELIDLVGKGIVKKEGERRWSTYSLA